MSKLRTIIRGYYIHAKKPYDYLANQVVLYDGIKINIGALPITEAEEYLDLDELVEEYRRCKGLRFCHLNTNMKEDLFHYDEK